MGPEDGSGEEEFVRVAERTIDVWATVGQRG